MKLIQISFSLKSSRYPKFFVANRFDGKSIFFVEKQKSTFSAFKRPTFGFFHDRLFSVFSA